MDRDPTRRTLVRTVTLTATAAVGGLAGCSGSGGPDSQDDEDENEGEDRDYGTPSASFEFQYARTTGVVTVVHAAGDTFAAENTGALRYGIEGSLDEWPLPVSAGDARELSGLEPGRTVVVVWVAPGGGKTAIVGSFDVPS